MLKNDLSEADFSVSLLLLRKKWSENMLICWECIRFALKVIARILELNFIKMKNGKS